VQGLAAIPPLKHVFEEHVLVAGADEPDEEDPVSVEPAEKQLAIFNLKLQEYHLLALLPSTRTSKQVDQEFINALL